MEYQLPKDISLTKLNIKNETDLIDIKQVAILFYLLRENGATVNYTDASFAKLIHWLTGHSESNLRTHKGFSRIIEIMKEAKSGTEKYNLIQVKKFLQSLLEQIDEKIRDKNF